jgi:hypothetical protein
MVIVMVMVMVMVIVIVMVIVMVIEGREQRKGNVLLVDLTIV